MLKELFSAPKISYDIETINILRLIRSENIGPKTFFSLIKLFGDAATAIDNAPDFSLRGGKSKPIKIFSKSDAEKELELLEKDNAKIITYKSPEYSKLLLEIYDPPPILSYKGNIELLNHNKCVAIVGARNASANGRSFAHKIANDLVKEGYITISGLARGIDSSVHQAAISQTIGVIAGGIDHIYPPENKKLFENLAEEGLILAELPIGSTPLGKHFPQRNRIISGLALGVVIVEASLKSGSLITAKFALEQNREIFAVPGFPLDPRCQGTNKLIREGAYLVESVDDIVANLPQYEEFMKKDNGLFKDFVELGTVNTRYVKEPSQKERTAILELLSSVPIDFEFLQKETELSLPIIYTVILELELAGKAIRHAGNKISLVYA
ncbi:DNA protecting protein DprA [Rickettsia felis str. Pedreira]|uniref:DNA protecting protein DprA n=2 Tax=Rickettsia felis TaxID=42862 RepID=A0A0F3MTL3_RICFI|nr:DNA-processing protein DprA [Rickettsia felis]AAY61382.1 Putatie DNA processing protein DprA [Rickettsia felis URRWXCal2]KHO02856.1 DNA processing protein DprA [Rickettsia felis str. LSU]KHO03819.1 DNA processing protein DprA [Rickettsia felis]KJV57939.1 DNA protecting protein DprA [Rickettsia felis str. Pedreira]MDE8611062.1 DNA-processing protein DprA [Rickettsia felis]